MCKGINIFRQTFPDKDQDPNVIHQSIHFWSMAVSMQVSFFSVLSELIISWEGQFTRNSVLGC